MKGLHSENFKTLKEKNWGRHRSLRDLLCTRITMINIWKKTSYQNQPVGPTQSPQNPNVDFFFMEIEKIFLKLV